MKVFHLGNSRYAGELTGKGAELYGGRWNRPGIPCIYTSCSLSLSVLEYAANNSLYRIPRALSYTVLEIPDKGHKFFPVSKLPGDWQCRPIPVSTMDFGTRYLNSGKYLVIAVPSVIVPQETNYLINPLHPEISSVRIVDQQDFVFDVRVKG